MHTVMLRTINCDVTRGKRRLHYYCEGYILLLMYSWLVLRLIIYEMSKEKTMYARGCQECMNDV